MDTKELREKIAKHICTLNLKVNGWDALDASAKWAWLNEADQILSLFNQWLAERDAKEIIAYDEDNDSYTFEPLRLRLSKSEEVKE